MHWEWAIRNLVSELVFGEMHQWEWRHSLKKHSFLLVGEKHIQ
jgi:hypothetical protein